MAAARLNQTNPAINQTTEPTGSSPAIRLLGARAWQSTGQAPLAVLIPTGRCRLSRRQWHAPWGAGSGIPAAAHAETQGERARHEPHRVGHPRARSPSSRKAQPRSARSAPAALPSSTIPASAVGQQPKPRAACKARKTAPKTPNRSPPDAEGAAPTRPTASQHSRSSVSTQSAAAHRRSRRRPRESSRPFW